MPPAEGSRGQDPQVKTSGHSGRKREPVLGEVGRPVDLGGFGSPSRGAQAKPEFTLQGVAGGPGGLSTGKAGMRASVAW